MKLSTLIKKYKNKIVRHGSYVIVECPASHDKNVKVLGVLSRYKDYDGKIKVSLALPNNYSHQVYPEPTDFKFVKIVDNWYSAYVVETGIITNGGFHERF